MPSASDGKGAKTGARTGTFKRGNEARRDGRLEVGASRSTGETGELTREDPVEGRGSLIVEPLEGNMAGASNPDNVSTKQQRIAELAKQSPEMSFTSLAYHLDLEWLYEAYLATRKDGAAGVDQQTGAAYAENLKGNLEALLNRAKLGTYRAPPVRRVHIPKGTGTETRPIGIPTFEDKVLQRAVVMALEPLYEQDFYDCSYGFRPGRSAHQGLEALRRYTASHPEGWVLEVDIRKFFDSLDHAHLREFLQRRVRDGVLLRLIGKWLNAGVLEDGTVTVPEKGTPQGGVISPLLSNIFLHYVLDDWFVREVQPRLKGSAVLVRYADDFVMGFACEEDARRVAAVLPQRFARYGLTLHPDKTRLVPFQRPSGRAGSGHATGSSGTFELLGFTHYWGRSWRGGWVVTRKTASNRFTRTIRRIAAWCREHRHSRIGVQQTKLNEQLVGHDAYYGITGNYRRLSRLRIAVHNIWRYWLSRRGSGPMSWSHFRLVLSYYPLVPARVVHSVYRVQ